jgi:predicted ABC-type ATPase
LIGEYQANAYAEVQKAIKANLEVQPSFSRDIPRNAAAQVENSASFDKALANARKRNQPIKKARVFDFDDTLARTNSRVIYSKPNTTGKPSPQLKAIVLAGGPGSGKSSIVKGLGLEKQGYKIVNQDISLEWAKKLVGLPEAEANYDAVQRSVRSQMGALARKIAEKKLDQYTTQGKGVILDGTGASLKATRAKIEALKDQGYDVKMVYVETSKDIALERNRARKERSLKDFIVEKTWDSVNANKAEYAKEFGEDFFKVNTDNLKPGEVPAEFVQAVNERLNATERGKLEAGGFAELGDKLANEGAQFDFREFSKVIDGKEGPLLNVAKMINEAKGDRNMFVLTARPPEAAASIHEFLKSMGLDIPIENITGLADGAPAAKARWMVEKAAEGYNDFYFADDHIGNVQAVGEALKGLQVKSKVQRAKPKESEKQLTEDLNKELSKEAGKDVSFSFDTKRDLKWKKGKGEISGKTYEASTEVGGQQVNIRLTEIEKGSWELDFGVGTKDVASGVGKMGITGKGDAFRIFSVVGNGVTELINKKGLKEINFSAIQPSRARVYETFTKLWAKKLGWEFEADIYLYGNGSYTIKKPGYKSKKSKTILSKIKSKASFSLDTKRDLKWKQHKENDRTFISKFKIGDKKYEIILADASGRGNVEFAFARLVGKDRVFDMIGDGNAYEVVSIVTNGLVDLIKSNRIPIKEIVFSADRPSRAKVYERIAKMWANELGWEMKRYDDYSETGADFAISRQEWAQKLIDQKVDRRGFEMQASDPVPKDFETIEPFTLEEQAAVREVFESQQRYREVLDQVDVKSEVQKERAAFSKDVDREFNELLESSTGVEAYKEFSPAKAEVIGAKKGRRKFFIPPSAEDFLGLLYPTLGKGKTGEANMDWYNKHLFKPYSRATANLSTDRANLMTDFKALKKQLNVPKDLRKRTKSGFTNEQAVRVYLWNKTGKEVPGLSKTDLAELNKIIEKDPNLKAFANQILEITKGDGYSEPGRHWLSGTITTDLIDLLNTTKRNKYLAEWNENVKLIFSPKNLNKLEAIYGSKYREALENSLARMKAGKNRIQGGNRLSNSVLNYINQGQGAIMFTNMRSALLQTISSVNYINWSFNNPYRAGKAFANQPQYWKDFFKLMNSDYLVDRRNGLKLNISENEIADAAKTSTNKAKAALNYIIEKGYLPTKFADSFAIASGGATFYRNRIKDLMKKFPNMELSKAEEIAFEEFRNVSEASQQSSDPGKISQQQASDIGRVMLQFVNTPMQYARLQKRSFQDLMNGRGSKKEHISKIIYYGFAQNIWFNFFQQGAFMLGFGDNTEEEWQKREFGIVNSMLDNILRGIGLAGMTVSVLKNTGIDIYERSKKDRPEYVDAWQELLGFSPSIKSKLQQFQGAGRIWDKNADEIFEKGFSLDNPAWRSLAKVVQGATALPLERLFQKADNLSAAFDGEHEAWQSVAMVLGWPEWQLLSQDAKDFNYAKENPSIYNKKQQEEILEKFGVPKWKIKEFKKEEDRVNEILRLQKKNKKYYKPKTTKEQIEKEKIYYDYDKVEQQKILIKHGMKYETIKKYYKTEEARVNAIINLEKKSGKKYKP